jgi:hypothetical protein
MYNSLPAITAVLCLKALQLADRPHGMRSWTQPTYTKRRGHTWRHASQRPVDIVEYCSIRFAVLYDVPAVHKGDVGKVRCLRALVLGVGKVAVIAGR